MADSDPTCKRTEIVQDILSSHISLEWERCADLPVKMRNAQAVLMDDKLYVGGGLSKNKLKQDEAKLYVYHHIHDSWGKAISTPSYWFALVRYQSQLVLVGGRVYDESDKPGPLTNQLWVMSKDNADRLEEDLRLPPMLTKRHSASAVSHKEYLLVAGGHLGNDTATLQEEDALDTVEVFNGHQWANTQSLPKRCWHMKSIVFEDNWWMIGGYGQEEEVYCNSLNSLISTAVSSCYSTQLAWKQLPKVRHSGSSLAILPGNKVLAIGGADTADVLGYTFRSGVWVPMEKLPTDILGSSCTITLPTGEVLAIGGEGRILDYLDSVYKGTPALNKVLWYDIVCEVDKINSKHLEREQTPAEEGRDRPLNKGSQQLVDDKEASAQIVEKLEQDMRILNINEEDGRWKLSGVEDLKYGETSVTVFASKPFQCTWEKLGLKLSIEEGSLPPGVDQCTISIKVSISGQYEFPEECYLVSAVVWLRCESIIPSSEFKFTKPVRLEIQHCARSENTSKLSFVRAVCTQKDLPYAFKLVTKGTSFSSKSSYGVIELHRFSGFGIVQQGTDNKEYCCSLYYLNQQSSFDSEIHFVVTLNTKVHLTAVTEQYEHKKARFGPDQIIEFESDRITLCVPWDGTVNGDWRIYPLGQPVIMKKEVDCFMPGKRLPRCHLKASHDVSTKRRHSQPLRQMIKLDGVKEPCNIFVIDLPAIGTQIDSTGIKRSNSPLDSVEDFPSSKRHRSKQDAVHCADMANNTPSLSGICGLEKKLDLDKDHTKIISYLRRLQNNHIRELGGVLGIGYIELTKMNNDLHDMVAAWLRKQDYVTEDPTWKVLIEALRKIGQGGIADDIEEAEK